MGWEGGGADLSSRGHRASNGSPQRQKEEKKDPGTAVRAVVRGPAGVHERILGGLHPSKRAGEGGKRGKVDTCSGLDVRIPVIVNVR